MADTNTSTYDKYIERINSITNETTKITQKYNEELTKKTEKINNDLSLTDEQKKERIKKLQERISKNVSEKTEKLKKELEETVEKVSKEVTEVKAAITKKLEKIAPMVALLTLPSPTPDSIVKWLGKAKDTVIKEKIEPVPVQVKQIIEIAAKVALITAAVTSAIDALSSSTSPDITIPALELDQDTLDILNSIPQDTQGNVQTIGFPTNPSLGDLYTNEEENTYQWNGSEWILINVDAYLSGKGSVYMHYGTAYLYKWSSNLPSAPDGESTFVWSSESNINYVGLDGWATDVPTSPNTPGISLWVASVEVVDAMVNPNTTVSWIDNDSVIVKMADVLLKADGLKTVVAKIFKWDITLPSAPLGTSTYTWETKKLTDIPSGWSTISETAPSEGFTLWEAQVDLFEGENVETSTVNWIHSAIGAVSYAGTQGVQGIQGETGDAIDIIFKRSATEPTTPNDSTSIPTGWYTSVSSIPSGEQTEYIWSCIGTKKTYSETTTVVLSNENIIFQGQSGGYEGIDFSEGSCEITAYIGTNALTYGTEGPNTFTIMFFSANGVVVSSTDALINAPTAMSKDDAYVDVTVVLRNEYGNTHSVLSKRINYSLKRANYENGSFGINGGGFVFTRDEIRGILPSSISLQTSINNIYQPTYQWYRNDIAIESATSDSYDIWAGDFVDNSINTYKCIVTGGIDGVENETREDYVTIPRLDSSSNLYVWGTPVRIEGELPISYNLLCSSYISKKNVNGNYTPGIISITAQKSVGDSDPENYYGRFKIYLNGSVTATYTSSSDEYAKAYNIPANTTSLKIELYLAGGTSIKLDETSVAIVDDGTDAITISLSNEAHSVPSDKDGSPTSYTGSGTDIYVLEKNTYLNYVTSITDNGQFTVSAYGSGITTGTISAASTPNRAVVGVHSAMTTNPASVTYTITVKGLSGNQNTYTKTQTFSKAVTGATGLSVVELSVYKRAATAQTTPTGGSFNFETKALTAPTGWSVTIPSGTDPVYVSRTVASSSTTTGTDSALTWSNPVISFQNGASGVSGSSYRACYARIPDNPTPIAGTATTSGDSSFPTSSSTTSSGVNNWGLGSITWANSDPTPSSTYTLYVCDGIYSPATGNTIWTTPYQASLKVGTLSAITANLGTVNAGVINSSNWSGETGTSINLTSNTFKMGGSTNPKFNFDGTNLSINNGTMIAGSIKSSDNKFIIDLTNKTITITV